MKTDKKSCNFDSFLAKQEKAIVKDAKKASFPEGMKPNPTDKKVSPQKTDETVPKYL